MKILKQEGQQVVVALTEVEVACHQVGSHGPP
jgi:hypothetical protein